MQLTTTVGPDDGGEASAGRQHVATGAADPQRSLVRTRGVVGYIALALLLLVPGIVGKLGWSFGGALADIPLDALRAALDDIRWGSGFRFWLGISGATMMGLMLLYPLRKALSRGRRLGSVGGWFHTHMILGLGGPVVILYHCNFGLGSTNANVALWSMLTIAISGILGYFVYGRASAGFYIEKQRTREQLDAIAGILGRLEGPPLPRQKVIEELEAFEARLLTPRQGIVASISARWDIERQRINLVRGINWLVSQHGQLIYGAPVEINRLRNALFTHLNAYVRMARHASSRSIREQVWARWRLFHLPVFLVMVAAVVLHVWAVWEMGPPSDPRDPREKAAATIPPSGIVVASAGTESAAAVGVAPLQPAQKASATTRKALPAANSVGSAVRAKPVQDDRRAQQPIGNEIAALLEKLPDEPVALPQPTRTKMPEVAPREPLPVIPGINAIETPPRHSRAASRPTVEVKPARSIEPTSIEPKVVAQAPLVLPQRPGPASPTPIAVPEPIRMPVPIETAQPSDVAKPVRDKLEKSTSAPVVVAPPQAVPAPLPLAERKVAEATPEPKPAVSPSAGQVPDIKSTYAEIQRRGEPATPMALGGAKRSLNDQIAELKARMASKQFFHSEAETGFLLSGKHLKLECTQCHSKPLKEARNANPRECVNCHKDDDVHKGRQTDCANCHTTNRWSQILKRRK